MHDRTGRRRQEPHARHARHRRGRGRSPGPVLHRRDLVETLYLGLADNFVGRVVDTLLRNDLVLVDELGFAPLDDPGTQLLSGSSPPATNADLSASDPTGPSSPGDDSYPNTPPPCRCSTGSCITAASWSPTVVPTGQNRPEDEEQHQDRLINHEARGLRFGHQRGPQNCR